jgi:hypothetical protein
MRLKLVPPLYSFGGFKLGPRKNALLLTVRYVIRIGLFFSKQASFFLLSQLNKGC